MDTSPRNVLDVSALPGDHLPAVVPVKEDSRNGIAVVSDKFETLEVKFPDPCRSPDEEVPSSGSEKVNAQVRAHRVTDESEYVSEASSHAIRRSFTSSSPEGATLKDAMAQGSMAAEYVHTSIKPAMPTMEERNRFQKESMHSMLRQIEYERHSKRRKRTASKVNHEQESAGPSKASKSSRRSCTNCGKSGHDRRNCNKPRLNSSGVVVVSQRKCTRCGSLKHDRRTCTVTPAQAQTHLLMAGAIKPQGNPSNRQGLQPLFHANVAIGSNQEYAPVLPSNHLMHMQGDGLTMCQPTNPYANMAGWSSAPYWKGNLNVPLMPGQLPLLQHPFMGQIAQGAASNLPPPPLWIRQAYTGAAYTGAAQPKPIPAPSVSMNDSSGQEAVQALLLFGGPNKSAAPPAPQPVVAPQPAPQPSSSSVPTSIADEQEVSI